MIDTRLLFNRDTVLGTAPDGVAEAGKVYLVPARYVRGFINEGRAVPAPGEPEIPPATSITTEDLGLQPEAPTAPRRNR